MSFSVFISITILILTCIAVSGVVSESRRHDRVVRKLKQAIFALKEENKHLRAQLSLPPERRDMNPGEVIRKPGIIEQAYNDKLQEIAEMQGRLILFFLRSK